MQSSSRVTKTNNRKCVRFSFDDIKKATSGFPDRTLGEGAFGKVYRGKIGQKEVAVKRMTKKSDEGLASFEREINLLTACDHVNVISLVGYCDEGNEKILVYEFMPNGSLYSHLFQHEEGAPRLTVEQRLEICLGVAKALIYLHSGTGSSIIHNDLKSDNILLDSKLVPKIADFGLSRSRVAGPSPSTKVTNSTRGTPGYIAPECYEPGYKPSRKADVYAFGVVLLEVLCEKRAWETLVQTALRYIMGGELERHTPEYVEANISGGCVRACEKIIKDCLEIDPNKRPTMDDVVGRLELALKLQKQSPNQQGFGSELKLKIPKGFSEGVVLYHTSSGVIVKTQAASREIRNILEGYGKRVDERDLYLNSSYKKQLQDMFGSNAYELPQLFIGGKYIGGADEIWKLHWNQRLERKLDRIPNRDYPSPCTTCANTRFASLSLCPECCFWKKDQNMDHKLKLDFLAS